jgi:hypothetical protein
MIDPVERLQAFCRLERGSDRAIGRALGLDGVILLAYVLAIPANEIVVPTILMTYGGTGVLTEGFQIVVSRGIGRPDLHHSNRHINGSPRHSTC